MKLKSREEMIVSSDYHYSLEDAFEGNLLFKVSSRKANRLLRALTSPSVWLIVVIVCFYYL